MTKNEHDEFADMLKVIIEQGQSVMCEKKEIYELSMRMYAKYRESRYAQENAPAS